MSGPINGITMNLAKTGSLMDTNLRNIVPRWYPRLPVAAIASGYQAESSSRRTMDINLRNMIPRWYPISIVSTSDFGVLNKSVRSYMCTFPGSP